MSTGLARGGGICRGERGEVIFGFTTGFGIASNTRVEFRAIHDGLFHCLRKGLSKIIIESDSLLVINLISGSFRPGWKWKYWLSRIKGLQIIREVKFQHILWEGNGLADRLARMGSEAQSSAIFHAVSDLPREVKGLIFLDKVGLGTLKC
ncbi:uncharacterized protein LOC131217326 [Magnolia sinica]|uniref:uncharacterized protein LOC131217326 n=1 Tax=Magnolia sinica TaxID=86752 RepID=UPI00265A2C90|nr:uncharacterized protein LOC131217326 [Magnolia sinica]